MAFIPRTSTTDPTPMENSPWWYSSGNKYYASGWGLPNCTCYCYGRIGEIKGAFDTRVPNGDGQDWWPNALAAGDLPYGQAPALGAIICFGAPAGSGFYGHVAIVEQIYDNGDLLLSNSGYPANYFWTARVTRANDYREQWEINRGYYLQGFLYPVQHIPTDAEIAALIAVLREDD